MNKVKITVLKTLFLEDLAEEYAYDTLGPCGKLKEGQVFYADLDCPEGFCHAAFRSIYQYVYALANGGGREGFFYGDWIREPGVAISSCNDGLRPVIFKLEATDIPSELPGKTE
ncbi:MAG: TIGR04076 family protein [Clostridia bacterium]|nr:TIGR04076 family protein [Clostridia bacterium]